MSFDPHRLADQLEADAKTLRRYGSGAVELAKDWATPLKASGAKGPKGDHGDPTATQAVEGLPASVFYASDLDAYASATLSALEKLLPLVYVLGKIQAQEVKPIERRPTAGAGTCQACTKWVHGTATDRLRSGLCDACRMAWDRAGRPDRTVFARERRQAMEAEASDPDGGNREHVA